MPLKTQADLEKRQREIIEGAKADISVPIIEKHPAVTWKEEKVLKGFKIPVETAKKLKILSAQTGKDQAELVIESLELLFSKYYKE